MHLFSELQVKDVTFRNRIGVSPMCQYSSHDGVANNWHMVHLGSRAVGGAGLVMTEATAVVPEGRITPKCAGIWHDKHAEALQPIITFIKDMGAVAGIQLAHAGRKGSAKCPWEGGQHLANDEGGYDVVGPSDEPFDDDGIRLWKQPKAMSKKDIEAVKQAFIDSAKRSLWAGFNLLEIHAAHGYLLHSFISPLANKRGDRYGGSLKNRARLLLEITADLRKIWPEKYPLAVRISTTDWDEKGLNVYDMAQVCLWLKDLGVDFIDCSSGGATPSARSSMSARCGEQVGLGHIIKKETNMLVMGVGEIMEARHANTIITSKQADICLLGRRYLTDPYWPYHAAQELGQELGLDEPKNILPVQNAFMGR